MCSAQPAPAECGAGGVPGQPNASENSVLKSQTISELSVSVFTTRSLRGGFSEEFYLVGRCVRKPASSEVSGGSDCSV